jgi:hypothetical protein
MRARPLRRIAFGRIAEAARVRAPELAARWLPDGVREGAEWSALNPRRPDRRRGSFRVNIHTGRWADFAEGARGGDMISLAAYLFGLTQAEAAKRLAEDVLGINPYG